MIKALSVLFGTATVGTAITTGVFFFGEDHGVSNPNYVACIIILATVAVVFIEGLALIYDEIKSERVVAKKRIRVTPVTDNTSEWTGFKTDTSRSVSVTVSQIKPAISKKPQKRPPSEERGFAVFELDIAA